MTCHRVWNDIRDYDGRIPYVYHYQILLLFCIYHIQNDMFDDDGGTIVYVQNNKRTRLNNHQQIIGDSPQCMWRCGIKVYYNA